MLLGKPDGRVGHALFVTALMHHQAAAVLFQRLPEAQHVAVAKNRKHPGHKFALDPVHFDVLVIEKLDQRLGHGQSCCRHVCTLELAQQLRQPAVRLRSVVSDDYLAVGMLNSGPLAMLSGQRCITLL